MELDRAEVGNQAGDPLSQAELHRRKREPLRDHPAGQLGAVFPGDRHLDSRYVKIHLAAGDGNPGILDGQRDPSCEPLDARHESLLEKTP